MNDWEIYAVLAALIMAAVALAFSISAWRARPGAGVAAHVKGGGAQAVQVPPNQKVAFVANPSKPDVVALRPAIEHACQRLGLGEPLWLETTEEDPGTGQAREALAQGADVVVAIGGDGTVRAVAEGMLNTGKPMGLLPSGTGNLLARNLDIPVADLDEALLIALEGRDRKIDIGWLKVLEADDHAEKADVVVGEIYPAPSGSQHLFLVIAGVGFDAAMVADTDSHLKARVGWIAYFVAALRHLHGKRLDMTVTLDDGSALSAKVRTILFGNCGRLPGGITLLPDAVIDDGVMDVAAIDTRGGVAGWAQLFGEVVMQGWGVRNDLGGKIGKIEHTQCKRAVVDIPDGEQAQVDGEVIGRAKKVEAWIEPSALIVRSSAKISLNLAPAEQ